MAKLRLQKLREEVLQANLELVRRGLVLYTFGNVSGISREDELVVIKPSGVPYEEMEPEHMVVTDLDGKIVEGKLRPSSDLPTHLVLYEVFAEIGGIAHTHSEYATAWAQAPCIGSCGACSQSRAVHLGTGFAIGGTQCRSARVGGENGVSHNGNQQ